MKNLKNLINMLLKKNQRKIITATIPNLPGSLYETNIGDLGSSFLTTFFQRHFRGINRYLAIVFRGSAKYF
jgi:hypothetical protein